MKFLSKSSAVIGSLTLLQLAGALDLDIDDPASIKKAAQTVGYGLMSYYANNASDTDPALVGTFPYPPYYWWESGGMWGGMVDYKTLTGDSSWQHTTTEALLAQVGPKKNFMMPNQRFDTGNDDQLFWVFAAMAALEGDYPQMANQDPTWLEVVENAWDSVIARWDTEHCNGGLRWQIFPENNGYTYKNAVSNGALFQMSARLARYTGKQKYIKWANKAWNWSKDIGFIGDNFEVYDGADISKKCKDTNQALFSYNTAIFMHGAANMYNITGTKLWADRLSGLVGAAGKFYSPYKNATNVAYESICEPWMTCNTDQYSFKAYLARFSAKTVQLAPFTRATIAPRLRASAKAAARSCSGGKNGVTCGTKWYVGGWDGTKGAGQQLSALETFTSLLTLHSDAPATLPSASSSANNGKSNAGTSSIKPRSSAAQTTAPINSGIAVITATLTTLFVASQMFLGG